MQLNTSHFASSLVLILLFISIFFNVDGQDRCGTVESEQRNALKNFSEKNVRFEQWIAKQLLSKPKISKSGRTQATYQIPVVVHIIHNGLSHATNISDEQVLSQINVLNKDFNRLNDDANQTPAQFLSVAGSLDIEFVLARQTPEGLPTDGIVRVQGTKTSWLISNNYELKSLSYWPAEDYLNIWVCNITDYIGYAQFPQSDLVAGIENPTNPMTDGVVIAYDVFGSVDDGNFNLQTKYNKGRTATHEIGHFLGLRHTWGDDGGACGNDGDYVDDTPDQGDKTTGCPAHPRTSCSTTSMFQNFLDYTNDACMNIFTQGQVERMIIVLENSPRRKTLLTSHGLEEPQPIANDLGIRNIISPAEGTCSDIIIPEIEVRNYGTNTITSALVRVLRNDVLVETKNFTLTLDEHESTTLVFSPVVVSIGTSTLQFDVVGVNNNPDLNIINNTVLQDVTRPESIATPFIETFPFFPSDWTVINQDHGFTWGVATAPAETPGNTAMKMDFYNYEDNLGEVDVLLTPMFDLSNASAALLRFKVAYAQHSDSKDGLRVIALSDCNTDLTTGTILYQKTGSALKTVEATFSDFTPNGNSDWRTESISLCDFIGQPNMQLAFVGINDYGNNLYLDNIEIVEENVDNITLSEIIAPGPVTCSQIVTPVIRVQNSCSPVSFLTVNYEVNGTTFSILVNDLNLSSAGEVEIELPAITLSEGLNDLTFTVLNPNGVPDGNDTDNTIYYQTHVATVAEALPLKQNFETSFNDQWISINPTGGESWVPVSQENNTTLVFHSNITAEENNEGWLISPLLDFSSLETAGLFFDISYIQSSVLSGHLKIMASLDCGKNFDIELGSFSGNTFLESNDDLCPSTSPMPANWARKFINLNALIEQKEVRLAFIMSGNKTNNIALDNIEFFLSDEICPVRIEGQFTVHPNPASPGDMISITYNLPERNNIILEITDRVGKRIFQQRKVNILNQTEPIDVSNLSSGLYLIRVITPSKTYTAKFIHR